MPKIVLEGPVHVATSYVTNGYTTHVLRFRFLSGLPGATEAEPMGIDIRVAIHAARVRSRQDHAVLCTLRAGEQVRLVGEFSLDSPNYVEALELDEVHPL